MKGFLMKNFNQIITNKVVNHLEMIANQEQEKQSSLLLIQSLLLLKIIIKMIVPIQKIKQSLLSLN